MKFIQLKHIKLDEFYYVNIDSISFFQGKESKDGVELKIKFNVDAEYEIFYISRKDFKYLINLAT